MLSSPSPSPSLPPLPQRRTQIQFHLSHQISKTKLLFSQMASDQYFSFRKLLLLCLVSFLFSSIVVCALSQTDPKSKRSLSGRRMLELEEEEEEDQPQPKPKKKLDQSTKNQPKLIKPKSTTNSTKKSATKPTTLCKTNLKKLNSTSNSIKPTSASLMKSSDLLVKPCSPKNKTAKLITKKSGTLTEKKSKSKDKLQSSDESESESSSSSESKSKSLDRKQLTEEINQQQKKKIQKPKIPNLMDQDDDNDDIVSELIPDLQRISTTSKAYLVKANKEITKGFKPIVGNKYAPTLASTLACIFIIVPLLLVSLLFKRIKAYFSLQKILIYIQVYLSIYFSILSLSSLVTGLEPLKFFYATSQSSYVCLQVLQTLGYMLYLLLLLMYMVVVFSTESGLGSKFVGLGQTMVGVAVGLHYYETVFHRAVQHRPPKTSWKVQGIYGFCFLVICLFSSVERKEKAYLHDCGKEGKKR